MRPPLASRAGSLSVVRPDDDPVWALTVGGGAYIFPRYLESKWPASTCDVVVIDPELTRISGEVFGLPDGPGLRTYHEDGRIFVNRLPLALHAQRRTSSTSRPPPSRPVDHSHASN
jgi:hypothetical protein